jgi:Fur family transcriptional regulator, peroxide stress response regulator
MNRFGEYLEHHGIKPSVQRLRIYEYLYRNRIHPTVDTIYSALSPSMPTYQELRCTIP